MLEKHVEESILETLAGERRQNALVFFAYLSADGMRFERGKGYWEDKYYWRVRYRDEVVCFVLINGTKCKSEPEGWMIWSDDSGSKGYEGYPLDERTREIAWQHVDFCGNCGGECHPGVRKTVFGRDFDHVCRTTLRFVNPDAEALACAMKMMEIRKNDINEKRGLFVV